MRTALSRSTPGPIRCGARRRFRAWKRARRNEDGVMKILVATDAWHPQVNGVVRTLTMMAEAAKAFGAEFDFLTPESFRTIAMPSYRDLRVALPRRAKIAQAIEASRPDAIHIATEGPIGLVTRRYCIKHEL